jgi:transposase
VLQADAYAGFNELYRNGRITEAACWAHARRKIHDVHVRTPSTLTEEALRQIGQLYAIEADIRGMPAEQRLAERQQKAKPLLKSLESWLREKMKTLSRHSELTKAFAYALNQWPALTYYAEDALRPTAPRLVRQFWSIVHPHLQRCKMASESIMIWHPAEHSGN